MTTLKDAILKDAILKGKLRQFIADRKDQPPGDMDKFNACLTSMAGTKKAEPGTSPPGSSEDSSES